LEDQVSLKKSPQITLAHENHTILIAEDEINNYLLLKEFLNLPNITILHAKNGLDALETCKNNPQIDLVLMDIKMPEMDGIVAFNKIREFRKDLPIIAQTAYGLENEKQQFLKIGFDDYIPKPILKEELLKTIKKCLEQ
jgi:CheY-like chemotaxis protein